MFVRTFGMVGRAVPARCGGFAKAEIHKAPDYARAPKPSGDAVAARWGQHALPSRISAPVFMTISLRRGTLHCRNRRDFNDQLLHVETGFCEGFAQTRERVRAVGFHRLLYHVMEHFLNEGIVGGFAANGELSHIVCSRQAYFFSIIADVLADGINGFLVLARAETSDRIELFEAEAQGIDNGMTALAGLWAS